MTTSPRPSKRVCYSKPDSNDLSPTMAASATTPPPLQPPSRAPTAKERKYDRQLRLWAASGQQALENAKILLLNSGPGVVGVETLKNLILPGVGSFTIVDEALVEEEDLGVNFFLTEESLGKSRAEECSNLLRELNPEVEGNGIRTVSFCPHRSNPFSNGSVVDRGICKNPTPRTIHPYPAHRSLTACSRAFQLLFQGLDTPLLRPLPRLLLPLLHPTSPPVPHCRHPPRPCLDARSPPPHPLARARRLRQRKDLQPRLPLRP